jgi:poly(A) polymerase
MIKLKELIMEGIKEKAALDYLMQLVKSGPFKGRVYLAGGAVRDMELGRDPKDLDVVVTGGITAGLEFSIWATKTMGNYKGGDSDALINFVKTNWSAISLQDTAIMKQLSIYLKDMSNPVIFPTYGTAKFTLQGISYNGIDLSDIDIEAVMTRKEKYSDGSRKPEVSAGDLADDVNRRDFTVNSLLQDLSTGEILDLTGKGKEDIKKGLVQTPLNPDIIFTEDPLRILRAARFAIKYNWDLPLFMLRAMKRNATKLENISFERIRDEIDKMLLTGSPERAIKLLKVTGVLDYVIPEFKAAYKMTQNKHHKDNVFNHILQVVKGTPPDLITRLQALFHDIGKTKTKTIVDNEVHFYYHEHVGADMTREILTRLKYPSHIIAAVVAGVKNHMRLKGAGKEGEIVSDKALRKFSVDLGDHLESTLNLMHSDNMAHAAGSLMPNQIPNIIKRIEALKNTIPVKGQKLPISGEDLKALGLKSGPLFKELLDLVKDKQLESPDTTKEEYLDLIKAHLKEKNPQ